MSGAFLMPSFLSQYFHALDVVAQVRYSRDDVRWLARLSDLMGATAWRAAPPQPPSVSITVIRSPRGNFWRIRQRGQPGEQPFTWHHEDALVQDLEWRLYAASAAESPASLMIHAGAVARNDQALLLPGVSGAGKTTLTYALAARGWRTLTDDLLATSIDPDDPDGETLALPCERCGHVSPQTLSLLAELGVSLEGPVGGLVRYFRPRMWGEAAPARYVIAPQYQAGAPCTATPMTQAETASLLMKASFAQRLVQYHQQWQAAVRMAAQTRGWWLTYGSLNDALDMVNHLTVAHAETGETQSRGKE
jgi:hypothetical protein